MGSADVPQWAIDKWESEITMPDDYYALAIERDAAVQRAQRAERLGIRTAMRLRSLSDELAAALAAASEGRKAGERPFTMKCGCKPTEPHLEDCPINSSFAPVEGREADEPGEATCPECDGVGAMAGAHTERVNECPACGGTGESTG